MDTAGRPLQGSPYPSPVALLGTVSFPSSASHTCRPRAVHGNGAVSERTIGSSLWRALGSYRGPVRRAGFPDPKTSLIRGSSNPTSRDLGHLPPKVRSRIGLEGGDRYDAPSILP